MNTLLIATALMIGANFPLCTDTVGQYYPEIVFANDQYYVFWCDMRYYGMEYSYALAGARISQAGSVLDPAGKILFKDQNGYEPAAAYDGTNFLVVFRNFC